MPSLFSVSFSPSSSSVTSSGPSAHFSTTSRARELTLVEVTVEETTDGLESRESSVTVPLSSLFSSHSGSVVSATANVSSF